MWNKPTLEDIEALELPGIRKVSSKRYEYRKVYMHFFNDSEEYYAGGFDPESQELFCYTIQIDSNFQPHGFWTRHEYDELLNNKSQSGAELTRNLNFQPCRAIDIPKIQACERKLEEYRQRFD